MANIENLCTFAIYLTLKTMFSYLKKYPVSFGIILLIIYLSFFKPPSVPQLIRIPHLDKVVHMGMYFVLSGMLWWEFLRVHKANTAIHRVWIGAFVCPVIFSGAIEILQEYCTSYRGGDWLDFAANATGALLASLFGYYILRPRIWQLKQ